MNKEVQLFAAVVHGFLVFGHSLGVVYNIRRKNWKDAAIHTAFVGYDTWAMRKHIKATKEKPWSEERLC